MKRIRLNRVDKGRYSMLTLMHLKSILSSWKYFQQISKLEEMLGSEIIHLLKEIKKEEGAK